jgi:hypothetical protein
MQFAAKQDSRITGRVLDSEGSPLPFAPVDLIRSPEVRMRTTTDENGRFAFEQLSTGAYKLRAAPAGSLIRSGAVRTADVATYFPAAIEESDAERIMISGSAAIDGFRLRTAPVVRVRGVVVDEEGKPSKQATVRLVPMIPQPAHVLASLDSYFIVAGESLGDGPEESRTLTGEDGSFEFPAVRAGEFRIVADVNAVASGVMPVIVQQRDIQDLRVRVTVPAIHGSARWAVFCVSGRLSCGIRPAEGAVFPIWLQAMDGQPSRLALGVGQSGGTFELNHVTQGRYRMHSLPPLMDG